VTLALDLGRLPLMEGVSARDAATSGEEYELLVAVPLSSVLDHATFARSFGIPLTEIGRALPAGDEPVQLVGGDLVESRGHDHLRVSGA
jgi:thiamine monophosphate kinase